ncbi:hypothetical protein Q8W71_21300 [Methylobacterium sp. NEAU 140]|uniref:Nmad2 family putative nucleotide modification protein n=1 Tax=Methylobacterium sp. NEAU 140 TaxID=3064945 RepID=UPI00273620E8|nr:hypothetical protein [Methylobacterium sp. NEAU 140]MDP4025172.1 hypothetical protein [Methylobacterium sp. NEAU 140]
MTNRVQSGNSSATSADMAARLHSYVVDHDLGFAPNPFHRICTLAACKPRIRKHAQSGDYIVGTGSAAHNLAGRIIYWMRVDEIITFEEYWRDPRFFRKRPVLSGSRMQIYGDNIYSKRADGTFEQADSFHSEPGGVTSHSNLKRDTAYTENVLIGREYAYWGGFGPNLPSELKDIAHGTQGHKNKSIQPEIVSDFISWVRGMPDRGFLGRPANWPPL